MSYGFKLGLVLGVYGFNGLIFFKGKLWVWSDIEVDYFIKRVEVVKKVGVDIVIVVVYFGFEYYYELIGE